MEYKTVRGGDEFLPLARSLVRKLRATGLSQAGQKVNVGSVTITVRIADDDDFISIEGGAPTILSGIIKAGEVVNIPADPGPPVVAAYDTLRALKPTQNCWETTLRKSASLPTGVFSDIKRLAKTGTQYADLVPSMFSGLMAKVVQVLLGRGVEVKYDYKFDKGHGVVLDNKGKPWLVEISKTNGVIAQKLGIVRVPPSTDEKNDALRECVELFGGVPNGKTFPKDADLEAAIEAKTVIRLASVDEMAPFFEKTAYTQKWGWSFNVSGSEGHNTCHATVSGVVTGFHYKLAFVVNDTAAGVEGSANLSEVSHGPLNQVRPQSVAGDSILFSIDGIEIPVTTIAPVSVETEEYETTIFVRHKDDQLDRIRVKKTLFSFNGTPDLVRPSIPLLTNIYSETLVRPGDAGYASFLAGRYIVSDLQNGLSPAQYEHTVVSSLIGVVSLGPIYNVWYIHPWEGTADYVVGEAMVVHYTDIFTKTDSDPSRGYWVSGCRDGVVLKAGPSVSTIRTYDTYDNSGYIPWFPNYRSVVRQGPIPSRPPPGVGPPTTFVDSEARNSGTEFVVPSVGEAVVVPGLTDSTADTANLIPQRASVSSLRNSVFGTAHHIVAKRPPSTDDSVLEGEMLVGEPKQSDTDYNFIGYLA